MSRQIQIRRGTSAEHASFTGAIGEVTMDTTLHTLRVHDGATVGGTVLAKQNEIPNCDNFADTDLTNISATAKEHLMAYLMPNYANATGINGFPFTVTTFGWLIGHVFASNGGAEIYVNGQRVITPGSWNGGGQNFPFMIPLSPGDIVTTNSATIDFVVYAPCNG